MINHYDCTENVIFFFDVETRNYRNFYTAKRNNEWALVNLQGQDRFVRHREQNDENKAQS